MAPYRLDQCLCTWVKFLFGYCIRFAMSDIGFFFFFLIIIKSVRFVYLLEFLKVVFIWKISICKLNYFLMFSSIMKNKLENIF
jgi:hypothetical protein